MNRHFAENSRRMRDFNRSFSMALYNAYAALPAPPTLVDANGIDVPYTLPQRQPAELRPHVTGGLVGSGPDVNGYYAVLEHSPHQVGDLWNDPVIGGVWCRVETPSIGGGMEPRWLRIT